MYQGLYRFILASMVVYAHLLPNVADVGKAAVAGFFMLSGFLVTRIVNGRYSDGLRGFGIFVLNRALRIYPTFWVCLAFAFAAIALFPTVAANTNPRMVLTSDIGEIAKQILIFGQLGPEGRAPVGWISVGWSLSVELVYYLLIATFLGRSKIATALWLVFGIGTMTYAIGNLGLDEAYFSYLYITLVFAIGAALHHFGEWFDKVFSLIATKGSPKTAIAAIALLLAYVFWQEPIGIYIYLETRSMDEIARVLPLDSIWIFYGTLPFAAFAMWATLAVRVDDSSVLTGSKLARVSDYLGELSYPVFLLHFAMLIMVTGLLGGTGGQGPERVLWHSLVAIPLVYILAMLVVRFVEQPVQRLRDKVRDLTHGKVADPRIKNVQVP